MSQVKAKVMTIPWMSFAVFAVYWLPTATDVFFYFWPTILKQYDGTEVIVMEKKLRSSSSIKTS